MSDSAQRWLGECAECEQRSHDEEDAPVRMGGQGYVQRKLADMDRVGFWWRVIEQPPLKTVFITPTFDKHVDSMIVLMKILIKMPGVFEGKELQEIWCSGQPVSLFQIGV